MREEAEMEDIIKMNGFEVHTFYGGEPFIDLENGNIFLNHKDDRFFAEFYPLKDRTQFIFHNYGKAGSKIIFGGLDESNLFLIELEHKAFKIFTEHGEESFYDSLAPNIIKKWSKKTGAPYGRQGIWFFTPLRLSGWYDFLRLMFHIIKNHPKKRRFSKAFIDHYKTSFQLLESNHFLSPLPEEEKFRIIFFPYEMFIAYGTLAAYGYKEVFLEKPHLLARLNYLKIKTPN